MMRRTVLAALAAASLSAVSLAPARAQSGKPVELSAGHLRLALTPGAGLTLSVRGVPFLTESSLYLVNPGWTQAYLNQDKLTTAPIATATENGAQVATVSYETPDGHARYRYEVRPDDTFRVTLEYGARAADAQVEFHTYLNANLLEGAAYTAKTVGGERKGTVSVVPVQGTQDDRKLTPDLSHITFDTRLGSVGIDVESNQPAISALTLFDCRAETSAWARTRPIFWFGGGVPSRKVAPGENRVTITYTFGAPAPGATGTSVASANGTATTAALPAAYQPGAIEWPVIPHPKEMTLGSAPLRLANGVRIHVLAGSDMPEAKAAAREIQQELSTFWGIKAVIPDMAAESVRSTLPSEPIITLALDAKLKGRPGPEVPAKAEGYLLDVRPQDNRIWLVGYDAHGIYNAAQTLKQLIRRDAGGVYVKPATVRDWPSLSVRGLHWYGGPNSWPFHKRMIDRVAAPLKINTMLYELEYTQWDSQPKIRVADRSTPKDQVKKTVAEARAHFIEPIPMIAALGHVDWLFRNGQNQDLAMDPDKPYAYNPDNPRAYDVMYGLFQEAIDLFHPKYFHIGHDEVTMTGRFPRPGYPKTATQLFIEDTERLHTWLTDRGIKTIMWGDQMLHASEGKTSSWCETPEDAKARREALPKDIIIADWHYHDADPTFPSIGIFQKLGYPVLGTGWSDQPALRDFVRSLVREKSLGYLQSTWAGYSMTEDLVTGKEFNQFVGYLLAAEYAWNGGTPDLTDLGYSPEQAFLHFWNRTPGVAKNAPGFTVDLSPAANAGMWAWVPGSRSQGSGDSAGTRTLPVGRVLLDGYAFQVGRPVLMAGAINPAGAWPSSLTVPLGARKAGVLQFLWGTDYAVPPGTTVARLLVSYEDGKSVEAPVVYGSDIFAFTDLSTAIAAPAAWQGPAPTGENVAIRRFAWANPRPQAAIRSVEIVSTGTEAAPVLLALTGVAKP